MKYYQLTQLIEKHIFENSSHPLFEIRKIFTEQFTNQYEKIAFSKDKQLNISQYFEEMVMQLIDFIFIFLSALVKFYQIGLWDEKCNKINYQTLGSNYLIQSKQESTEILQFLYSVQNFYNFTQCLIFASDKVYDIAFNLQKKFDLEQNEEPSYIPQKLVKRSTPNEFGVSPQFCLNESTIDFLLNYYQSFNEYETKSTINQNKNNKSPEGNNSNLINTMLNSSLNHDSQQQFCFAKTQSFQYTRLRLFTQYQQQSQNRNPLSKQNSDEQNQNQFQITTQINQENLNLIRQELLAQQQKIEPPFQSAIELFQKIEEIQTPLHKLIHLENVQQQALFCIQNFYYEMKIYEPFQITNNDLIFIYLYIMVKANVKNLNSQFNFIENFINFESLTQINGSFSYLLVRACLDYLNGQNQSSQLFTLLDSQFI